jgi:endonuclease YncB( thermonuclease family)
MLFKNTDRSGGALALVVLAAVAALAARGDADTPRREHRSAQRAAGVDPALVLGEFQLAKVVDGDTIKVEGLDGSLRLIGIDAEETFKSEADRRAAAAGLGSYMAAKRGASARPVKMATPLGEEAKQFAKAFFAGLDKVRLERDDAAEVRDRYGRYLAYALAERDGRWVNYSIACVRAGMAPYFPKYGRSRRFHDELVAAQAAAKREQRGIWAPGASGYPDYPEREAWWTARGEFVEQFRRAAAGTASHVDLSQGDAIQRLAGLVGTEVVVLGVVSGIHVRDRGPTKVMLASTQAGDFPLVFFDRELLAASRISRWLGELVMVTGSPTFYEHGQVRHKQLQLVVRSTRQLRLSPVPGLAAPTSGAP